MEINKNNYYKNILILCLAFVREKGSFINIDFDKEIQNSDSLASFVDSLTDAFCQYGLKENDEPNECGLILEDAIDHYNNLIYKLEITQQ